MWRIAMQKLENWKNSGHRRPLLLRGARSVGKTWLMREFGRTGYTNAVYIHFNQNSGAQHIFDGTLDAKRIIKELSSFTKTEISPETTLIILDDIQWCPKALIALNEFRKSTPEYHIIAAGNFLEVICRKECVEAEDKIDTMTLYPMTFLEFLTATDDSGQYAKALQSRDWDKISVFHDSIMALLGEYLFVGGMPAAVKKFLETGKDRAYTQREHEMILAANYADFSQRPGDKALSRRAGEIWNSVPKQLQEQNRRFLYSRVRPGSRGRDFDSALEWLKDTRMMYALHRVRIPQPPLADNAEPHIFKLYLPDIGLMCAMCGIRDPNFGNVSGGTMEQFVFQELLAHGDGIPMFYWNGDKNYGEIEFVLETKGQIVPVKIRLNEGRRHSPGMKFYKGTFKPKETIYATLGHLRHKQGDTELPIYMLGTRWE